jgi:hypothetical protein
VHHRERDGEQKREIKMAMKQYDLDLVKRQNNNINRLMKAAMREESALKGDYDHDSDVESIKRDFYERPVSEVDVDIRSLASFDSNASE